MVGFNGKILYDLYPHKEKNSNFEFGFSSIHRRYLLHKTTNSSDGITYDLWKFHDCIG